MPRCCPSRCSGRSPRRSPPWRTGAGSCSRSPCGSPSSGGAAVQLVEEPGVLLVDDVALDLERRGQLARLLREVVIEDRELLDLLDLRVLGVGLVELGLDELVDLWLLGERRDV